MGTDHLKNAKQSLTQRTKSAFQSASENRFGDAVESAYEGIAEATEEVGESVKKNATNLIQRNREND